MSTNTHYLAEKGPSCDLLEDRAVVFERHDPDRMMLVVADGCGGGSDLGAAAAMAVLGAWQVWDSASIAAVDNAYPDPLLTQMFEAAHQAVLSIPSIHSRLDWEKEVLSGGVDSYETCNKVEEDDSNMLLAASCVFHDEHRHIRDNHSGGCWDPATTMAAAVWDERSGLRWAVCGDSWLFAVAPDGRAVCLEESDLRMYSGGCLGVANPRPYYGAAPDADGWTVIGMSDGAYPLLGDDIETILDALTSTHQHCGGNTHSLVETLMHKIRIKGLDDDAAIAAFTLPR